MLEKTFSEFMLLQRQYRNFYDDCENEILMAIKDFRTKLQNVFVELYPNEEPLQLGKMFFNLKYRWLFVDNYTEIDDTRAGSIVIKIFERDYELGGKNEVIQEFPLTYQLLTENGRQELVEKWKNVELKYIEEMKNKNLEDEKVKREERIKRLEQELNLLKNID
jgi:hypothetical protein